MNDREFIAVFHYDNGGTNRCGAEPYRYAEEIVRCKECRHRKSSGYVGSVKTYACEITGFRMHDQTKHFCSYGERSSE